MKAAWDHGGVMPCACRRAIVSVAASSTTRYPASSNARTIEVFPQPGVPVSMYRFIVSSNSGSFVGPISAQARPARRALFRQEPGMFGLKDNYRAGARAFRDRAEDKSADRGRVRKLCKAALRDRRA